MKENPKKIHLAFRNYPLPSHRWAKAAAIAAEAAGEQGKFWLMHDYIFAHQGEMETPVFTAKRSEHHFAIAQKLKPDVILLAHGAAIVEPEHAAYMLKHTGCHGVQLGSSIERMAIERPIEARTASFKAGKLPAGRK